MEGLTEEDIKDANEVSDIVQMVVRQDSLEYENKNNC